MTWTYDTISKTLSDMGRENYEDMVKAILAMELGVHHKPVLENLYNDFMAIDDLSLLSEDLRLKAGHYQEQIREELTDLLEKLYRTGEGSSFIMDAISSNNLFETINGYDILDSEDYSSLTIDSLQGIIQEDLALTSQDYFGDVTVIALNKDLLDQKSHFLQHYVASLLESMPQTKDQSTLVLD